MGAVGSHQADARTGWFEYGVTIGAEHRRQGYAAEAAVLLLRFMFEENRSLPLHRRLGFVEGGRLRELVYLSGR